MLAHVFTGSAAADLRLTCDAPGGRAQMPTGSQMPVSPAQSRSGQLVSHVRAIVTMAVTFGAGGYARASHPRQMRRMRSGTARPASR